MQAETQEGSTQCMHCCFMYWTSSPTGSALITFFVVELRSLGASYTPPFAATVSGGSPFATLQADWQARQPTQRVESKSIPTASGPGSTFSRA
jgi:hypothetical protein